jgi:hypothetical protein
MRPVGSLLLFSVFLLAPLGCSSQEDIPDRPAAPHPMRQASTDGMRSPHAGATGDVGAPPSPHGRMGAPRSGPDVDAIVPEVKRMVEETVTDRSRAEQVESILQDLVKEVRLANQETRGFHEQLNALNANYDAKREQFEQIVKELQDTRAERAAKILDMRFRIRELMTAQEWKNLTDRIFQLREHRASYGS